MNRKKSEREEEERERKQGQGGGEGPFIRTSHLRTGVKTNMHTIPNRDARRRQQAVNAQRGRTPLYQMAISYKLLSTRPE